MGLFLLFGLNFIINHQTEQNIKTNTLMTNELLEIWRKEADELYNTFDVNSQRAYIDGCKATHENMMKIVEDAYDLGYHVRMECEGKPGNEKSFIKATSFNKFKKEHNIL